VCAIAPRRFVAPAEMAFFAFAAYKARGFCDAGILGEGQAMACKLVQRGALSR